MKTILAPTEFSETSENSIDYATELAKITNAKIVLLHVFSIPVVPAEVPIIMPIDEIEKNALENLKKIEQRIRQKYGDALIIECVTKCGFPVEEINLFAKSNGVDLIVMGTESTDSLTEKLLGNITTSLMKKANCPVLAIDKLVTFKPVKKIALACDYTETDNDSVLVPLKELAQLFGAHIYVLNVPEKLESITTISKAAAGIKLNHSLERVEHSFHYSINDDVIEGINDFVTKMEMDMVVMIPRMHTVLHNLFHEANSKRMAFHTKIPLLALHE